VERIETAIEVPPRLLACGAVMLSNMCALFCLAEKKKGPESRGKGVET